MTAYSGNRLDIMRKICYSENKIKKGALGFFCLLSKGAVI
jgi:hypothetical protein